MKGNEKVIEQLNIALCNEMSAVVQYMVQAEMCEGWGYKRLAALTKGRAIEEMKHAEPLMERVIFLDGMPNVAVPLTPKIGVNVPQQLEIDLADETAPCRNTTMPPRFVARRATLARRICSRACCTTKNRSEEHTSE